MSGEGQLGRDLSQLLAVGAGLAVEMGTHTNTAASESVQTGLATVTHVVVSLKDDPSASANAAIVSAAPGSDGKFTLKSWEADGTAATSFGEDVSYIAIGTPK